ncbi:MAG TPA: PA2779 family protein [Burkholderiaceae bacterium]|nr:PA2779 family protein [Burkholderiaceae bacterium]HYB51424.1 PA2779 family protein [Burkholderiaceae bacterium]
MNLRRCNLLAVVFVCGTLTVTPMVANAGIVSTDQLTAQSSIDAERAQVQAFLDRASAAGKLQALGVNGVDAQTRVSALSDTEVHALAEKIDSLPAGGDIGSFTNEQIIIIVLLLILVAVIVSS